MRHLQKLLELLWESLDFLTLAHPFLFIVVSFLVPAWNVWSGGDHDNENHKQRMMEKRGWRSLPQVVWLLEIEKQPRWHGSVTNHWVQACLTPWPSPRPRKQGIAPKSQQPKQMSLRASHCDWWRESGPSCSGRGPPTGLWALGPEGLRKGPEAGPRAGGGGTGRCPASHLL